MISSRKNCEYTRECKDEKNQVKIKDRGRIKIEIRSKLLKQKDLKKNEQKGIAIYEQIEMTRRSG